MTKMNANLVIFLDKAYACLKPFILCVDMSRFQQTTNCRHFENQRGKFTHAFQHGHDVFSRVALGRECCRGRPYLLMDTKVIFASQVKKINFEVEADRMLQSVHLVGEDEDDLYSGFNEYNPAFDTEVRSDVPTHMIFLCTSMIDSAENNICFKAYVVFSLYQEELEFDRFFFSCLYRIKINEGSFSYCRLDFSTKKN